MSQVFRFTWLQNTKGKGFVFATCIFPVLLCALCIFLCVFLAVSGEEDEDAFPLETVYVDNQTELSYVDFTGFATYAGEQYKDVTFLLEGKAQKEELHALDITLKETKEEYAVKLHVPEWSELSVSEASDFNDLFAGYVEKLRTIDAVKRSKGNQASEEEILTALMPVDVEHTTVGDENAGVGAELIKMLLPMVLVFVLYMMVLLYGQAIGKIVISEKVSKLMETLLISVKPYQLITGKILAIVAIAVMQILLWVLGLAGGLFFGDFLAEKLHPGYQNVVFEAMDLIRELSAGAFSVPAVLLGILSLICGFIFYCVLAGLFASPVSKAEELSASTGLFQTFVVIAFMAAYLLPLQGIDSEAVRVFLYVLPFTSSFMLSGDILVGNLGILPGAGYLLILIALTSGVAVYAGKLYKNQVFYHNAPGSFLKRMFR